jgi:putative FmdB family regulatory protein
MPTYEYQCTSCGHYFEAFQRITEEPLNNCPKCGKRVKRLIGGGAGIIFKGSGFYTTDNKRSSIVTGGNGSAKGRHAQEESKPAAGKKDAPVASNSAKTDT